MDKSISLRTYTSLAQLHPLHAQIVHLRDRDIVLPQDQDIQLCSSSRKIFKKRSKYNKINDEIRLKLIEAVEKNGEMLKSAAKKYKVNYSSAKSIFQTYRKEGRVLRKINKTRRPHRESSTTEKELSTPKLEETISTLSTRYQADTPTPETDHNFPALKPVQEYLSPINKPFTPLSNLSPLVNGFNSAVKRDLGEDVRRFLALSHPLMVSQQILGENGLFGQSKAETLFGFYPMMQAQSKANLSLLLQPSLRSTMELLQNTQYSYLKSLGDGMRLDAVGLLVNQLISSGIPPN